MKTYTKWFGGTIAGFLATTWLNLFGSTGYAAEAVQNPLPAQVVLNQTNIDSVPMIAHQNDTWPSIQSPAAVVMDMSTGTVVYAKNPNQPHYPASITKVMTAMLALQHGQLNDTLVASSNAVGQEPDKLYLVPGESQSLEKLLYGLLLISANDAAVVIAENYGGSVQGFATMMNDEAKALGATHTHFENPNGLPNPNHLTTAYDMSLITRAAMQYPEFRKIVSTKDYHWQGEKWQSNLTNLNKMLYYYPGAIGVKTGFTSVAHNTLIVAATQNHETFLAVLMDAQSNYEIRQDAAQLLNHAFTAYHTQTFLSQGTVVGTAAPSESNMADVVAGDDLVATVKNGDNLNVHTQVHLQSISHDMAAGSRVGSIDVYEDGTKVATVPAILERAIVVSHASKGISTWDNGPTYFALAGVTSMGVLLLGYWLLRRKRMVPEDGTWSSQEM